MSLVILLVSDTSGEDWEKLSSSKRQFLCNFLKNQFNLLSDPSSLMFPTIDDRKVYDVQLASEDIKAIQKLYGRNTRMGSAGRKGKTS